MTMRFGLAIFCLLVVLNQAHCAPAPMAADPADHIIRANRDGLAIDPLTEKPYVRPEQFAKHIAAETDKWTRVVKQAGIKAE